jgi:hypothetical protein
MRSKMMSAGAFSSEDLAGVFGKKEVVSAPMTQESDVSSESEREDGVVTKTSALSMNDYFKQQMAARGLAPASSSAPAPAAAAAAAAAAALPEPLSGRKRSAEAEAGVPSEKNEKQDKIEKKEKKEKLRAEKKAKKELKKELKKAKKAKKEKKP